MAAARATCFRGGGQVSEAQPQAARPPARVRAIPEAAEAEENQRLLQQKELVKHLSAQGGAARSAAGAGIPPSPWAASPTALTPPCTKSPPHTGLPTNSAACRTPGRVLCVYPSSLGAPPH